jgi:hypothetical protein
VNSSGVRRRGLGTGGRLDRLRAALAGPVELGAHARIRTGDLRLTKAMLYHLSYVGASTSAERF